MQFDVLGPLQVSSRGRILDLGAPAQRALLALLLSSPHTVISVDRLIEELWADDAPPSAQHLVHVYVSRLRSLLEDAGDGRRIVRQEGGYKIVVEPDEIDVERFVAALEEVRGLPGNRPERIDQALAEALRLWRGAPFADLIEPPPAVAAYAVQLELLQREAHHRWIDARLQLGKHEELVAELATLAAEQQYDEPLHAQLMLALYRCNRQAEALAVGRQLVSRLRHELAIEPSAEVADLYRDILLQAVHLKLEPPEPPGNLPRSLTSFVGRSDEIRTASELLAEHRLVTLTGPGGIGKTRLALELARQERMRFRDGTWWIDLAVVVDPDDVPHEIAAVLRVTAADGAPLADVLPASLGGRETLLVLDNCEHVAVAVADFVSRLLRATERPRVLATSRTPLRVEGEQLWRVPPLGIPSGSVTPAGLDRFDATRLLVERGRAANPSLHFDDGDAAAAVEVCARLDGISLAIEMAAARLSVLTPAEIVRHLDDRFALLRLGAASRPSRRHETMEAAIETSLALLSPPEREAFARLGVFLGPVDLDAVAAVALPGKDTPSEAVTLVTDLVEASLLTSERDGSVTRYSMLETLREYGRSELRRLGLEDRARQTHASYYVGLTAAAGKLAGLPESAEWMRRLAREYPEIRQALGWSLEHEPRAVTLAMAPALRELWIRGGLGREAGMWSARMLDGDVSAANPELVAEVLIAASIAALLAQDLPTAEGHARSAERMAREAGATRAVLGALTARCTVDLARGDMRSLRSDALAALAVADTCGRWARAMPLDELGFAAMFGGGSLDEARALFEEALPLHRELGDLGSVVPNVLGPLSTITLRLGDLRSAEAYAAEAIEAARGTGWEACGLVAYSDAIYERGEAEAAGEAATRAARIARQSGLENWFRMAVRNVARSAAAAGRLDDAAFLLGASRVNMPPYGLDPQIYDPIEQRCRQSLGDEHLRRLSERGAALTRDQIMAVIEGQMGSEGRARGPTGSDDSRISSR